MNITKVIRTEASFAIEIIKDDKSKQELELSVDANWAFAQLTKYEYKSADSVNRNGFRELRRLGILKLCEKGLIVEPVKLSKTGENLQDLFANLQFKGPGSSIDCVIPVNLS